MSYIWGVGFFCTDMHQVHTTRQSRSDIIISEQSVLEYIIIVNSKVKDDLWLQGAGVLTQYVKIIFYVECHSTQEPTN